MVSKQLVSAPRDCEGTSETFGREKPGERRRMGIHPCGDREDDTGRISALSRLLKRIDILERVLLLHRGSACERRLPHADPLCKSKTRSRISMRFSNLHRAEMRPVSSSRSPQGWIPIRRRSPGFSRPKVSDVPSQSLGALTSCFDTIPRSTRAPLTEVRAQHCGAFESRPGLYTPGTLPGANVSGATASCFGLVGRFFRCCIRAFAWT